MFSNTLNARKPIAVASSIKALFSSLFFNLILFRGKTYSQTRHFIEGTFYARPKNPSPLKLGTFNIVWQLVCSICGVYPLLSFYYIVSMSMFYQVMGAVRCPKIKKHAGIKLRPASKAKDPFMPNDVIIYSCESLDFTQSIKCLEDGRWSDIPHCPDPVNNTCPDLEPIIHGFHNATGPPYKVGTVVAFKCENEILPNWTTNLSYPATSSPATTIADTIASTISNPLNNISENRNLTSIISDTEPMRYNLTGHRILKCLPSSKWNHQEPSCVPMMPTELETSFSFTLTSVILILIPILILATIFQLIRRRKRQQQRARWKQYFTDYKYRHSKTNITFDLRTQISTNSNTIPVTDL